MKLLKATLLFGGLLALATSSLSAESGLVNVNVPFQFVVGGTVMPAGTYTIEQPSITGVLMLRGSQPNSTAIVIAVNAGPANSSNAGVTFDRRGSEIVMSTVVIPGGSKFSLRSPEHKAAAAVSVALPRQ